MAGEEAEFHYSRDNLSLCRGAMDLQRSAWAAGAPSPAAHLVLATLDMVTAWGGVVDELDYMDRLRAWWRRWGEVANSSTLATLMAREQEGEQVVEQVVEQVAEEETVEK